MTLAEIRAAYSTQIGSLIGSRSPLLLKALAAVPRERFVGSGPWTVVSATAGAAAKPVQTPDSDLTHIYGDVSVAMDVDRKLYNGTPTTLGKWIDHLDLGVGDRVFHLGGGSGYYTAIMAEMVGPTGDVLMAEVDDRLAAVAQTNLASYPNVRVIAGDGGMVDPGLRDAVLINAGVTHPHPLWLSRLDEGGTLLVPLTFGLPGINVGKGALVKIKRSGSEFDASFLPEPVMIYSCSSVRDEKVEGLLLAAYTKQSGRIGEVRRLRLDSHEAEASCWMHSNSLCLSMS